jgi:hypothetical protein
VPVPNEEVRVGVTLVRVSGERERLPDQLKKPLNLWETNPDPSIPGGVSLVVQMQVVPKNFGTCYLEIDVDGELVTKIPFTIRRAPVVAVPVAPVP